MSRQPLGPDREPLGERAIISLIGAIQFVNVLDFMMVMPLGPDLAAGVGIPVSRLGLLRFSYAAAACCAGALGALFLDRFGRRSALAGADRSSKIRSNIDSSLYVAESKPLTFSITNTSGCWLASTDRYSLYRV